MDEEFAKELAAQLRKPEGEDGLEVAKRMNESNRRMNWLAIESLNILNAKGNVLELGIGNGKFAFELLEKNIDLNYVGIDYSATMVAEAQKLNIEFCKAGRAQFALCTADQLPLPNNHFHYCWGSNIIYFWDQPEVELKEIFRTIQPKGKIALSMRSDDSLKTLPVTQFGFNIYTQNEVKSFMLNAGFKNVQLIKEEEVFKLPEETKEVHLTTWVWVGEK